MRRANRFIVNVLSNYGRVVVALQAYIAVMVVLQMLRVLRTQRFVWIFGIFLMLKTAYGPK